MRKVFKNPYNWYLLVLFLLNFLPFLAPLLLKLAETFPIAEYPAKAIYLVYSFTCHQFHHRSLHVYDHQCAWCTRDVGIWLGVFVIAWLSRTGKLKGIPWYWILPFIVPIALDGGIQTIATVLEVNPAGATGEPLYVSNNFVRYITGIIFGTGLSLWLSPSLWLMIAEEDKENTKESIRYVPQRMRQLARRAEGWLTRSSVRAAVVTIGLLIGAYLVFVLFWSATSVTYQPSDALDSIVRTPATDFFTRRLNGSCPSDIEDLFSIDCFLPGK